MKPRMSQMDDPQQDLYRMELLSIIDPTHALVKLAAQFNWQAFDQRFGLLYDEQMGAPAKSTRLMVGLHYLKHTFNLSDEAVVAHWVENPYWQHFCGAKYFEHALPIDPSSMTKWRKRVGADGVEELLRQTVLTGLREGAVQEKSLAHVNVDTTVQEKAVAFPTDARLYNKMRECLVRLAKRCKVRLRQSYVRVGKETLVEVGRLRHPRQAKKKRAAIRHLKTLLGRVTRDIEREIQGNNGLCALFKTELDKATRLLGQERQDKKKLYSVHAPEVECISKGKAHKRYEFGCKVALASTSKEGFVIACQAIHGNPYDGHTLTATLEQAGRITNREITGDVFVDRGYKGHGYIGKAVVLIAGQGYKTMTKKMKKLMRRRSAIEPLIGHMKSDGRLGRNYLKGQEGDKMNALLSACGQNMRLLLNRISFLFFCVFFTPHTDAAGWSWTCPGKLQAA